MLQFDVVHRRNYLLRRTLPQVEDPAKKSKGSFGLCFVFSVGACIVCRHASP